MPPEETLDEVIERHALNSEMGAVSQLMQEKRAMQNESAPDRLNKALAQIRALKSADCLKGQIAGLSLADLRSFRQPDRTQQQEQHRQYRPRDRGMER